MCKIFRLWTAAAAVVLLAQPLLAAQNEVAQSETESQTPEEWQQNELRGLVDAVGAAVQGELVQTDDDLLQFQPSFLKGAGGDTYIPFTVRLDPSEVNKSKVLMYLFVLPRDRPAVEEPADATAESVSNWFDGAVFDDAFFVDVPDDRTTSGEIELQRSFSAPGGAVYEVYLAIRDSMGADADEEALAESMVMMVKEDMEVPDLWNAGLQTSTVILADSVEPLERPLTPEEQIANPFTLGATQIVPKRDRDFGKEGELSLIMLVYNPELGADQKPDVTIEYDFHQRTDTGEEFFNRTNPQQFNAQTLPPGFDMEAGHQIVAGQSVPLASFPVGSYRLEITVTDNVSGGGVAREVIFDIDE